MHEECLVAATAFAEVDVVEGDCIGQKEEVCSEVNIHHLLRPCALLAPERQRQREHETHGEKVKDGARELVCIWLGQDDEDGIHRQGGGKARWGREALKTGADSAGEDFCEFHDAYCL